VASALFDIGGTHTRLALTDGSELLELTRLDTRTESSPVDWLAEVLDQHLDGREIDDVILALPGEVSGSTLVEANNLPHWSGTDFTQLDVEAALTLVNDADAAALGEAYNGAGRGQQRFGYVTISTGVGGGLVQDGRLSPNQLGFEVGEQIIDWSSGASLESLAGGASVLKREGQMMGQMTDGQQLQPIIDQLATGLFNAALLWSTNWIVVNGPSLFESEQAWPLLRDAFTELQADSGLKHTLDINRAEKADLAGLYGCLVLANDQASAR